MDFMNVYVVAGVSAFLMTFIGVLISLKVFPKIGLMDRPADYGLMRQPIPYSGGW